MRVCAARERKSVKNVVNGKHKMGDLALFALEKNSAIGLNISVRSLLLQLFTLLLISWATKTETDFWLLKRQIESAHKPVNGRHLTANYKIEDTQNEVS